MLLDVSKDMIFGLCGVHPVCRAVVFKYCVPQLREWLLQSVACALTASSKNENENSNDNENDNENENENENNTSSYTYTHAHNNTSTVPPSLVDVCIEILCKLANSMDCNLDGLPFMSEVVLTCLSLLFSTFQCTGVPCRKEGLQGVNTILSYHNSSIIELFSHSLSSSSLPSFTSQGFATTLSDLLLITLQDCVSDPYTHGNCAGSCAGLLCHLLIHFKNVMNFSTINTLLGTVLQCLSTTTSTYVKYSLLMGLIHLFARDAMILAIPSSPFLGTIKPLDSPTTIKALAYVLDEWCTLHHHLTSKYSGTISSLGFFELIKIFNMHKENHEFALKILRLTLSTLPRILLNTEGERHGVMWCGVFYLYFISMRI